MLPLLALLAGAVALGSSPILVRLSELEPTATAFYRVALAAPAFLLVPFAFGNSPTLYRNSKAGRIELLWLVAAGGCFALDLFLPALVAAPHQRGQRHAALGTSRPSLCRSARGLRFEKSPVPERC